MSQYTIEIKINLKILAGTIPSEYIHTIWWWPVLFIQSKRVQVVFCSFLQRVISHAKIIFYYLKLPAIYKFDIGHQMISPNPIVSLLYLQGCRLLLNNVLVERVDAIITV